MNKGLDPDTQPTCQYGECRNPMPSLPHEEYMVLLLFSKCRRQFNTDTGYKTGVPWSSVKAAADALGMPFNEYVMDKFDACVDAVMEYDQQGSHE